MIRLSARSPAEGLTPLDIGGTTLIELDPGPLTLIAPYPGGVPATDKALKALGLSFPAPGQTRQGKSARVLWFGAGQALLVGAAPPGIAGAAVTDQSDAWTCLRLEGPAAEAVLARLVPIDLSARAFPEGATARSLLNHMALSITRVGAQGYDLMLFRSMAATAVHEIAAAMASVAARD